MEDDFICNHYGMGEEVSNFKTSKLFFHDLDLIKLHELIAVSEFIFQ